MAQIIYDGVAGDGRIQLAGDEFVRSMNIGAYWTRIRLIMRCSPVGVANTAGITLAMGVMEGNQSPYSRPGTKAFVGCYFSNNSGWTFNAGPPAYYSGSQFVYSVVRTNGVETTNQTALGFGPGISQQASGVTSVLALTISKNNTTYSPTIWIPNQASAQTNHTAYQFLLDSESETSVLGLAAQALTNVVSTGYLDTLSIYCSSTANPFEISDVMVVRFA